MKKFTKYILFISLGLLCSCSDYLDIVPDNVTTLDIVFNNKNTAQRYLANCYHFVPDHGSVKRIPGMGAGHECWFYTDKDSYLQMRHMPTIGMEKEEVSFLCSVPSGNVIFS